MIDSEAAAARTGRPSQRPPAASHGTSSGSGCNRDLNDNKLRFNYSGQCGTASHLCQWPGHIWVTICYHPFNQVLPEVSFQPGPCLGQWLGNRDFDIVISKPGYYYDTIMTSWFWIYYTHYDSDTIMTLLLHWHLWHLQKSDYYDTLWQKPGKDYYYTYDMTIIAIMTFWIYYDTYVYYASDTQLYYIHYHILTYFDTYDIEVLVLLPIMTIAEHYVHYTHYETIISIIAFWFIITLMTLRYYYWLLWQLQNIMCISTIVIKAIIHIMVIKYFRSYWLTKVEYWVGYWF